VQGIVPLRLSESEWRSRLTPAQFKVLREEGTERAGTSPFNSEKRKGIYQCAGCDLPLFDASMKFDSGTGWPSFFNFIPGALLTKTDFKAIYPRKEYHCARCGGHHGHVFDDGPKPMGLRYCNNGVALKFVVSA
jgi:peptide-methionine (R)-S-oxide reductase